MIRHVAVFRWHEGTTEDQVAAVRDALAALPAQIPELKAYEVGADMGLGEGRWDFAVVAHFGSADDYQAYVDHPAHQAVANDLIAPIRADRAHVQIET